MSTINLNQVPIGSKIIHQGSNILGEDVSWIVADDEQYGTDGIVLITEKAVIIDKAFENISDCTSKQFLNNTPLFEKLQNSETGYLSGFDKSLIDALMDITVQDAYYGSDNKFTEYSGKIHLLGPRECGGHKGVNVAGGGRRYLMRNWGKDTFKYFLTPVAYDANKVRAKPTQAALDDAGWSNNPNENILYGLRGSTKWSNNSSGYMYLAIDPTADSGDNGYYNYPSGDNINGQKYAMRLFIKLPNDTKVSEPIEEGKPYQIVFNKPPVVNITELNYPYIYFSVNDAEGLINEVTISINGNIIHTYPSYSGGPLIFKIDKNQSLNSGDNTITISATDDAMNITSKNIILNKSDIINPIIGDYIIINGKSYQIKSITQQLGDLNLLVNKDIQFNSDFIEIPDKLPKVFVNNGEITKLMNHESTNRKDGLCEDKFTLEIEGRIASFRIDTDTNKSANENHIERLQAAFEYKED